jgi:hypothetical protein
MYDKGVPSRACMKYDTCVGTLGLGKDSPRFSLVESEIS